MEVTGSFNKHGQHRGKKIVLASTMDLEMQSENSASCESIMDEIEELLGPGSHEFNPHPEPLLKVQFPRLITLLRDFHRMMDA